MAEHPERLGVLIPTDPDMAQRRIPITVERSAVDIKRALGCDYFEFVCPLGLQILGYGFVVDEEGILNDKPKNILASFLYGQHLHGHHIYGPALVLNDGDNLAPLTSSEARLLIASLRELTARADR